MSELLDTPAEPISCPGQGNHEPAIETLEAKAATLGAGMTVRRALPRRGRRMVGPWCFLDHFGPAEVTQGGGMRVGPHPHIGLQTVTWLLDGAVLHRDSLGHEQLIRPGQLNIMTAGRGIAHSEESPAGQHGTLHGLQLWLAQPEVARWGEPAFEHVRDLPRFELDDAQLTLIAGEALDRRSPAPLFSAAVALDIVLPAGGSLRLPLEPAFEHACLVAEGAAELSGRSITQSRLYYAPPGVSELALHGTEPARIVVIGGAPFGETILMWWNFVARTAEEIHQARDAWQRGDGRFGTVAGYDGPALSAPALSGGLR